MLLVAKISVYAVVPYIRFKEEAKKEQLDKAEKRRKGGFFREDT